MNISDSPKIKNQMQLNNLDFEKDKLQQQVDDAYDASKNILHSFNFTTERFKQVYMKDDFIPSENATANLKL